MRLIIKASAGALLLAACLGAAPPPAKNPAQTGSCSALVGLTHPGLKITAATDINPAPLWKPPGGGFGLPPEVRVPFCRVEATIEGDIGLEVWLPRASAWKGRLLGAGVGGSAGYFNFNDMARGLPHGFAVATTDTGHKGSDNRWMMDMRKRDNYAHRAQHLLAVASKAIAASYYGRAPAHNYFIGCSGGGRQGLKEVQVYPGDYDGVISGSPGPDMPTLSARHLWTALYGQKHPNDVLNDADWALVERAVTNQCDALDGVKDGLIGDPRQCRFDPASLDCAKGAQSCLPANKISFLKAIYAPLRDENGVAVDPGLFAGVRTRPGPPPPAAVEMFAQGVYNDPAWDPNKFRIARDVRAINAIAPHLRANNSDLRGFKARGGKLILYSGWMDPSVIATQTLGYYQSVRARFGNATDQFTRLYMVPGGYHCAGGPGPERFGGSGFYEPDANPRNDLLLAMVDWVENGRAPQSIVATKVDGGKVVRSLPLCPFPQIARYSGKGDVNAASSYSCRR